MTGKLTNILRKCFRPWRILAFLLVIYDLITVGLSYYLALALRFERLFGFPGDYVEGLLLTLKVFPVLWR